MRDLETDRLILTPLMKGDLPVTLGWRNQDDARVWFGHSDAITSETHEQWFRNYLTRVNDLFYIARHRDFGRAIAQGSLFNIDFGRRRAEIGRFLVGDPADRRLGYASEVVDALVKLSSNDLSLDELYLQVVRDNVKAIRLYKKHGFEAKAEDDRFLMMVRRKG